ncbi:MAG: nuclear transport factor 2 family protein [Spirochaetales bacterium]|nr:nuclear transport factor 2 family protein [Spirochaetales bacterium]
MNHNDAFVYLKEYFHDLFVKRSIDALDNYLHPDYHDDDIGDNGENHIENTKSFLKDLFKRNPSIGMDVKKAVIEDNVITAYLNWYIQKDGKKEITIKNTDSYLDI